MKFKSTNDKKLFLIELEMSDLIDSVNESWTPDQAMLELFARRRRKDSKRLKNFRKSQLSKQSWRHNKYNMMKGIKAYHKSTKGKRMHRAVGNLIATRSPLTSLFGESSKQEDLVNVLKGLSSIRTQAYIGLDYYTPQSEYFDYEIFVEMLIPLVNEVEKKILIGEQLSEEDFDFLGTIVETTALLDSFSTAYNKGIEEVTTIWSDSIQLIKSTGIKEEDVGSRNKLISLIKSSL